MPKHSAEKSAHAKSKTISSSKSSSKSSSSSKSKSLSASKSSSKSSKPIASKAISSSKSSGYVASKAINATKIVTHSKDRHSAETSDESSGESSDAEGSGDEDGGNSGTDNEDELKELQAYRSKSGKHVYVPDAKGEYVRWSVIHKPPPSESSIKLKEVMELDGCEADNRLFLRMRDYVRTITRAAVDDSTQYRHLSSEQKASLCLKARKKHGYLYRFKGNWATEEFIMRAMRNRRDIGSRITNAGGEEAWKAKRRSERKAKNERNSAKKKICSKNKSHASSRSGQKRPRSPSEDPQSDKEDCDAPLTKSATIKRKTKRPRIESDNEEDDDGVSIPIRPILRKDTVKSKGKGKAKATTDDEQEEGNTPVGWVDYPVETEEELSDSFLSEQIRPREKDAGPKATLDDIFSDEDEPTLDVSNKDKEMDQTTAHLLKKPKPVQANEPAPLKPRSKPTRTIRSLTPDDLPVASSTIASSSSSNPSPISQSLQPSQTVPRPSSIAASLPIPPPNESSASDGTRPRMRPPPPPESQLDCDSSPPSTIVASSTPPEVIPVSAPKARSKTRKAKQELIDGLEEEQCHDPPALNGLRRSKRHS